MQVGVVEQEARPQRRRTPAVPGHRRRARSGPGRRGRGSGRRAAARGAARARRAQRAPRPPRRAAPGPTARARRRASGERGPRRARAGARARSSGRLVVQALPAQAPVERCAVAERRAAARRGRTRGPPRPAGTATGRSSPTATSRGSASGRRAGSAPGSTTTPSRPSSRRRVTADEAHRQRLLRARRRAAVRPARSRAGITPIRLSSTLRKNVGARRSSSRDASSLANSPPSLDPVRRRRATELRQGRPGAACAGAHRPTSRSGAPHGPALRPRAVGQLHRAARHAAARPLTSGSARARTPSRPRRSCVGVERVADRRSRPTR